MMAADYRHIGGRENRLGRHYSRFSPFLPAPALASQSLALRKLCDAGSNRRRRVNTDGKDIVVFGAAPTSGVPGAMGGDDGRIFRNVPPAAIPARSTTNPYRSQTFHQPAY